MCVFVRACVCVCVNVNACVAGLGRDVDDDDDVMLPMTRFSGCHLYGCPSMVYLENLGQYPAVPLQVTVNFSTVGACLVAQMVKNLPAMQETWIWSLDREDPLEEEMTTHSSILAWRIPRTNEPGAVQSMRLQRVRHNWVTKTHTHSTVNCRNFVKVVPWRILSPKGFSPCSGIFCGELSLWTGAHGTRVDHSGLSQRQSANSGLSWGRDECRTQSGGISHFCWVQFELVPSILSFLSLSSQIPVSYGVVA